MSKCYELDYGMLFCQRRSSRASDQSFGILNFQQESLIG
jgi:hypothetical protein